MSGKVPGRVASRFPWLGSVALAVACATSPVRETASSSPLLVTFASDRQLQWAPCGCTIRPLGGVDRELNLLRALRKSVPGLALHFTTGVSFRPPPGELPGPGHPADRLRAEKLVAALKILGTTALGVESADLRLGIESLERLRRRADFPFLSTNIVSSRSETPLFQPFLEIYSAATTVLVMAVARPPANERSIREGARVLAPLTALRRTLAALPPKPRLVVVLSSLSREEKLALARDLPAVNLWLGGPEPRVGFPLDQLSARSLSISVAEQGREIGAAVLEPSPSNGPFFNDWYGRVYASERERWHHRRSTLLLSAGSPRERAERKAEREELDENLRRTAAIPSNSVAGVAGFRLASYPLDGSLATQKNELSSLAGE